MSRLKIGTLCITVGSNSENVGRIVVVLGYVGPILFDPRITRGYRIRTASARPFLSVRRHPQIGKSYVIRNASNECIADRSNLRPLLDPDSVAKALRRKLSIDLGDDQIARPEPTVEA